MSNKSTEKKTLTTYEEHMQKKSPEALAKYKQEFRELLLSELLHAIMKNDDMSVRVLARAAGISPTIIQEVRSGKRQNVSLKSFMKMIQALGYSMVIEKPQKDKKSISRIPIEAEELFKQSTKRKKESVRDFTLQPMYASAKSPKPKKNPANGKKRYFN